VADAGGEVDLAAARPVEGSYAEPDPMGLVWSMELVTAPGEASCRGEGPLPPTVISFTAEIEGQVVAEATAERVRLAPGVRRTVVRERGLVGTLFLPPDPGPHAGIILLGGSEGGLHEPDAALLAAHGYATLALAYFGVEGVPTDLVEIPLEYFGAAIEWLRALEGVRGDRLGVIGGSRGGEAALLLGAIFPAITAVVSYCGSGVITQGIGGGEILEKVNTDRASWTHGGRPLPYLPSRATPEFEAQVRAGEPVELWQVFHAALEQANAVWAATLPVERINGPVLLISAGDDRSWPTTRLSAIAEERLARHNHPFSFRHLHYQRAGHGIIPPPYGPTTMLVAPLPGGSMQMGGTPQANAAARVDAWRQTLAFLTEHLG
jgi:dienelactone hydrolase